MVENGSTSDKRSLFIAGLLLFVVVGWGFYFFGLEAFLEAAYSGNAWSYFNEYAARWRGRQADPTRTQFLEEARVLIRRLGVLGTVVVALGVGAWWRRPTLFSSYLSEQTSPFNLALFRIAVFGTLLAFDLGQSHWYAKLPETLQFPPPGLAPILSILPTDPSVVSVSSVIFRVSCLFGLFGLFTRAASIFALVSGLYVLGIPQFYGKINHYHHVLWFTALLVPSRSADVLSLDAVRRSRQASSVNVPEPARQYALPLRYAWILLGIVYFFPGVWKLAGEGLAWAFSENLKYRMHAIWFSRSFTPLFRLDHYPILYQGAGLFTILFEVGFLFTLPFRTLRPWAAGIAYLFHESTRLFLAITFWTLYPILPFLLDLRALCVRGAKRIYSEPLILRYNPEEAWQSAVVETLLRLDLFGRIHSCKSASETEISEGPQIVVVAGTDERALWRKGRLQWRQFFRIVGCAPTVLPFAPFIPLLKRNNSGEVSGRNKGGGTKAISLVGGILIVANVVCGIAKINSYPFSVYPTFAVRADSTRTTLRVEGDAGNGHSVTVLGGGEDHQAAGFSAARFRGLSRSIFRIESERVRTQKLRALWRVLLERNPKFRWIEKVRFYEATYSTNPDRSSDPLLSTRLITTLDVSLSAVGDG